MKEKMTFDDFKERIKTDDSFRESFTSFEEHSPKHVDVVDLDNGFMLISRGNIAKYLEKYMCKDEEELQDTLWYSYGVFVKIVE